MILKNERQAYNVLFDKALTGISCSDFLDDAFMEFLEDVPLATCLAMWLQPNSSPAHFAFVARRTAKRLFRDRWIEEVPLQGHLVV